MNVSVDFVDRFEQAKESFKATLVQQIDLWFAPLLSELKAARNNHHQTNNNMPFLEVIENNSFLMDQGNLILHNAESIPVGSASTSQIAHKSKPRTSEPTLDDAVNQIFNQSDGSNSPPGFDCGFDDGSGDENAQEEEESSPPAKKKRKTRGRKTTSTTRSKSSSSSNKNAERQNRSQPTSGTKLFYCRSAGCGQTFKSRDELRSHSKSHRGQNQFRCTWDNCSYDSAQRCNVVKHVRTVHFKLPLTVKDQKEQGIEDDRDPGEYIEDIAESSDTLQVFTFYKCTWQGCMHESEYYENIIRHVRMKHFQLPRTLREMAEKGIQDDRDPGEYIEAITKQL